MNKKIISIIALFNLFSGAAFSMEGASEGEEGKNQAVPLHSRHENREKKETAKSQNGFLIRENGRLLLEEEGGSDIKHPPACSFNPFLSYVGYDLGILKSPTEPEWDYKEKYNATREILKAPHNPTTWMEHSALWYGQVLANEIGIGRMGQYLTSLGYGHQDLTEYKKPEGELPGYWFSPSLQISPYEQLNFLENLVNRHSSFKNANALSTTLNIIPIEPDQENQFPGWTLRGKTGAANKRTSDGSLDGDNKYGWYVGYAQKGERKIFFVRYLEMEMPGPDYPSSIAKKQVKEELKKLIDNDSMSSYN